MKHLYDGLEQDIRMVARTVAGVLDTEKCLIEKWACITRLICYVEVRVPCP